MANASIVQGLFGVDPTLYQMGQQARQEDQAMQFAQLDPFQKANYGLYRGGQMVGNIGANLMGVQDPLLQKATMAHQLASKFDLSTPDGLKQYAAALANGGAPELAVQANAAAQKMLESQATIYGKTREHLSTMGKLVQERDALIRANPQDPRIVEYNKVIAAEGSSRTPQMSMDVKMLDMAGGRRKSFLDENKPIIEQASSIQQGLTLARTDSAFSEAALENTLASAFGGDKQKSRQEVNRLINTGSLDERIKNSLSKFITGKTGDMTQQDRINVLEAVQGDLQRKYNKRRESTIKAASGVKELAGQEDYMAPTFQEMVGGGAYAGSPAVSVGQTANTKKYGVVTYTKVNAAGQPTEFTDSKGQTYTLQGNQ